MHRQTYPFPLAAHSSHHSHYHRFLLGADPAVVAPFPKPYCTGALAGDFSSLAGDLNLPRWRKLYPGAFPWVPGFGSRHYDLGNVPAHRPLPPEYSRPERRYGAYDFVLSADPAVSALALVAGDRRVLDRFLALGNAFCLRVESGVGTREPGPSGSRSTRRLLAGQFAEPNNRWLMPFLHVHSRVLNFTSFKESPAALACIDSGTLARSGQRALQGWASRQSDMLTDLGYRVSVGGVNSAELNVEGVSPKLIAATQAPRIAVLRLLERMILGDPPPSAERLGTELPAPVIAAMAEHVERTLAGAHSLYRPAKVGIPSEGPWRTSVRDCLRSRCPGALLLIDAAAARARATPYGASLYPTPPLDVAHRHAPSIEVRETLPQAPCDPELSTDRPGEAGPSPAPAWLVRDFEATLAEVNERIAWAGPGDPLVALRGLLATIDNLPEGASVEQLDQSRALLEVELERRGRDFPEKAPWGGQADYPSRDRLVPLEQLFDDFLLPGRGHGHTMGGPSL
jgi:hypothetical protein